jgi:hypothetical protein
VHRARSPWTTSSGATPPNTNTSAVSGIDAKTRMNRYVSALNSLATTIDSDEIGVVASMSSVCFSRSRLIAPAVNAGARATTSSVSSIIRALNTPRPIDAEANAALPPRPRPNCCSRISSIIHAKVASRTR